MVAWCRPRGRQGKEPKDIVGASRWYQEAKTGVGRSVPDQMMMTTTTGDDKDNDNDDRDYHRLDSD